MISLKKKLSFPKDGDEKGSMGPYVKKKYHFTKDGDELEVKKLYYIIP